MTKAELTDKVRELTDKVRELEGYRHIVELIKQEGFSTFADFRGEMKLYREYRMKVVKGEIK